MKELAEKLLGLMEFAAAAKAAGEPGNYQAVINRINEIFEGPIKTASARMPALAGMVRQAKHMQVMAARMQTRPRTAVETRQVADRVIILTDDPNTHALKKKALEAAEIAANEPPVSTPFDELLNLTGAQIRDSLGSMGAVQGFARELFGMEQGEQTDAAFLASITRKLKEFKTGV